MQAELRAKLSSMISPKAPDTTSVEEEIRTLPHVITQPFDLKRGAKYDMMSDRVRARHRRRRRRTRFNWEAPDCSSFSRIREITRDGIRAQPLRSQEEPLGLSSLTPDQKAKLWPHTSMMQFSLNNCIEDELEGRAALLESPANAITWCLQEAVEYLALENVYDVLFDACMHGARRRKASRLRTNVPEFAVLQCFCQGSTDGLCDKTGEPHLPWVQPIGNNTLANATLEAEYPTELCDRSPSSGCCRASSAGTQATGCSPRPTRASTPR